MSELLRPTDNYNTRVLEALQNLSADVQALRVEVSNLESRLHTTQDVAVANAGRQIEFETRVGLVETRLGLLAATTVPLWLQLVVFILLAAAILYLGASIRDLTGVLR